MKKHEDLLGDDLAAFEEFDQLSEPGSVHEEKTASQDLPPVEKKAPKKAAAKLPSAPVPVTSEPETVPVESAALDAFEFAPDVPVHIVAVLAKKTISLKDLFELRLGSVLDLARPPSEYVDLVANGKLIGRGELVELDGKLGVRIINLRTR